MNAQRLSIFFCAIVINSLILKGQDKLPVFIEKFENNEQAWPVGKLTDYEAHLSSNGNYIIDHKDSIGANLIWNKNIRFNEHSDYSICAEMKQLSGSQVYGYGIVWGASDARNFYAFTISSDQSYNIYKFEDGTLIDLKEWTYDKVAIKIKGYSNNLKIKKTNNAWSFFVNEQLLFSCEATPLFGSKTGFVINSEMKIAVNSLVIKEGKNASNKKQTKIAWVSPQSELSQTNMGLYQIEAGIKCASKLKSVKLYVNNWLIHQSEGLDILRSGHDQLFDDIISEMVQLREGINELKITIEDVVGTETSSIRVVKYVNAAEKAKRKDYVLLFATNEYDYWDPLANPINDAQTIANELSDNYGFETQVVENATRETVLKTLKRYSKTHYNSDDQLLILFAGHGKYDELFDEGYVVCKNSLQNDEGNASMLPYALVRQIINNIPSEHILLLMDVCFSGSFTGHTHRGQQDDIYKELTRQQFIAHKLRYKSRKFVTSGDEYVPDGTPGNHSPFARKILEALRSYGGEDRILTFSELTHSLERVKPIPRYGEFGDSQPGSEFLFISTK